MKHVAFRVSGMAVGLLLFVGCTLAGGGSTEPNPSRTTSSSSSSSSSSAPSDPTENVEQLSDVERIDDAVRTIHQDAFAVVSEEKWTQQIERAAADFANSQGDERAMVLGRLVGLLDTHTNFFGPPEPMYGVWLYRFTDGLYVVTARDDSLVGARLVAINGTPARRVERLVQATVPGDNASAHLNAAYLTAYLDRLHGLGIVNDPERPRFTFELSNGKRRTVDPVQISVEAMGTLGVLGAAAGDFTEAVRRRDEPIWWRTDRESRSFVLSVNDYVDPSAAIAALFSGIKSRRVDRLVIDMRYLRGGDFTPFSRCCPPQMTLASSGAVGRSSWSAARTNPRRRCWPTTSTPRPAPP